MGEQTYTFRDPSFNIDRSPYFTLLIQVNKDSFSYAVINDKQLIASGSNLNLSELENPIELMDVLTASYKNTIIGLPSDGFTLVPTQLFNKDQVTNYARLLNVQSNEKVLAQELDKNNFIIYKTDKNAIAAIQNFGINNLVYWGKGWLTAVAQSEPSNHDIYVQTENSRANILYFKDGSIRFYNSFEYKNADDLIYYTSLVIEELGLNPDNIELKLSSEDKNQTQLARFFKNVVRFDPRILELPSGIGSQNILTLAALSLCESSAEF